LIDTIRLRLHGANQHKKGIFSKMIAENTNSSYHLCPEHNDLFVKIHNIKKDGFTITKVLTKDYIVNSDDNINDVLTSKTTQQVNEHYVQTNKVMFQSSEYVKERTAKAYGKYKVRSSESEVTFSINYEGGYIDFEFSIPKYMYGHNLAQFIPQVQSNDFYKKKEIITLWKTQKLMLFDRLNKFVNIFLQDLFMNMELPYFPNMNYVELVRIDLCYNQYFDSKEIAIQYLNEQKKLKKHSKIYSPDTNVDFDTTIAWRTQHGNYFKIYHKGSEYINQKHGDFKKHTDINNSFLDTYFKSKSKTLVSDWHQAFYKSQDQKEISKDMQQSYEKYKTHIQNILKRTVTEEVYHISDEELLQMRNVLHLSENIKLIDTFFLKKEMDKILRYEVSISGKYASYQFKNYIFRKNCRIHQEAKRIYKKVKRQIESVHRFDVKIPHYHMALYNMYKNWFNKSNSLVFSTKKSIIDHSKRAQHDFNELTNVYKITDSYNEMGMGSLLETKSVSPFTQIYLIHLVDNFRKLILDFQVEQLHPYDTLKKRVERFNQQAEINIINYNNKKILYHLLSEKKKIKYDRLKLKILEQKIRPIDLLTEKEKQDEKLQKMSHSQMKQFFLLMTSGEMSAHQIQQKLELSSSQYYRRKVNLKLLGISEKHVLMKTPIKPKLDFYTYYFKTSSYNYRKKFFLKPEHSKYF
jgi:hypothetical protein